jgi:hypothetical protein
MNQEPNSEAAETVQTTNVPAVDLPRLVRPFIADEAPLGTIVQIGLETPDERLARSEFHRYLFQYFEQLNSGQTGWGVDFNAWLEMTRGWKHHGRRKYERIMSIGEMIHSEPNAKVELPRK